MLLRQPVGSLSLSLSRLFCLPVSATEEQVVGESYAGMITTISESCGGMITAVILERRKRQLAVGVLRARQGPRLGVAWLVPVDYLLALVPLQTQPRQ